MHDLSHSKLPILKHGHFLIDRSHADNGHFGIADNGDADLHSGHAEIGKRDSTLFDVVGI